MRWWIAEPRLLGCHNPSSAEVQALAHEGFSLVVSLLDEAEQAPNYDLALIESLKLERHNIPVRDFQSPTRDQLMQFVQLVDGANEKRIVLHCLGGSGRTGTFAAAYWIAQGMTAREAVLHVRKAKLTAIETREQLEMLSAFEQTLRSGDLGPTHDGERLGDNPEPLPTGAEIRLERQRQQGS